MTQISVAPTWENRTLQGLGSINRDTTLNTSGVMVSAFHLSSSKEAYFAGLGGSFSQEASGSHTTLWSPTLYGMATYHFTQATALLYGAAFTSAFGIFIPFPVLGLYTQFSKSWALTTILPAQTQLSWNPSDRWGFAAFLRGSGFEAQVDNSGSFPGRESTVKVQAQGYEIGLGASHELSRSFSIQADAGALLARSLTFKDSAGTILTQSIDASPFTFSLGMSARFDSFSGPGFH